MNGPMFAHGQMRLYLLILLSESPKHGYELIQSIEQRFDGAYVPSAGTVYPRLAKLAEEGLVTKTERGRKTVYAITDAGREEIRQRGDEKDQLEDDIDSSVRMMADSLRDEVHHSMSSLKDDLKSASSHARAQSSFDAGNMRASAASAAIPSAATQRNLRDAQRSLDRFDAGVRIALNAAVERDNLPGDAVRILNDELTRVGGILRAALQ